MRIASIKLSTVNFTKADPFSLSITIIDKGEVQETMSYRFNIGDAEIDYFLGYIPSGDLRTGPSFADQWPEICELLTSCDYLCCFRSRDDFNSLYQSLIKRELPFPSVLLFDVQGIARRLFLDLPDYMFSSVAFNLGIEVENKNIGAIKCNSETTAELVLRILGYDGIGTLEKAFEKFDITPGMMGEGGYQRLIMTSRRKFLGMKDPKAEDVRPDPEFSPDPLNFFYDKNVVFTGSFKEWGFASKEECYQLIANIGGYPQRSLNSHTNVLVEGVQNSTKKVDGVFSDSGKQKKAREIKAKGKDIEIISGDVFLDETFDYRNNINNISKKEKGDMRNE